MLFYFWKKLIFAELNLKQLKKGKQYGRHFQGDKNTQTRLLPEKVPNFAQIDPEKDQKTLENGIRPWYVGEKE